jgi:hypothetical protein
MSLSKEAKARVQKNNEATERQAWDRDPIDLFADMVEFYADDSDVIRITFRTSRPDLDDPLGSASVVTARITVPWHRLNHAVRALQDQMAIYETVGA